MNTVRCSICRQRFQTLKSLYIHLKFHSKTKIIQKLLEHQSTQVFKSRKRKPIKNSDESSKNQVKTCARRNKISKIKTYETASFIVHEIQIICGKNDIISVGDDEQSIKLTFNKESKDQCYLDWNKINSNCEKTTKPSTKRKVKKKKVQKQKDVIKITKPISLDDQNGVFYTCHCRDNDCLEFQNPDIRLVTSDTESCSETSKNSCMPLEDSKLFCTKCGSGYKTEVALLEHMYLHEPFCRLCNTWFVNEIIFKQHMQLHKFRVFSCHFCGAEFPRKEILFEHFDCHMEDRLLEDVLDMEEVYKTYKTNFLNDNYNTSINNIMSYLSDVDPEILQH